MRHSTGVILVVGLVLTSRAIIPDASYATDLLKELKCVKPNVHILTEGQSLGLNEDVLQSALYAAVKAKAPRLRVDTSCSNQLEVRVITHNLSTSNLDVFTGFMELRVRRVALILDTTDNAYADVYGIFYKFWGPTGLAENTAISGLDRLVTEFAAAYYHAGNP